MIEEIIFENTFYLIFETDNIVGGSLTDLSYNGDGYEVIKPETITIITF
jgi:hypothetical protein